jgi:hypothetical protein
MFKAIGTGLQSLKWGLIFRNWRVGLWAFLSQKTLFKTRPVVGFIHAIVAWGFTLYLFVNVFDLMYGFIPGFKVFPNHFIGHIYRFFVDVFSILILFGILYFISRRFLQKDEKLKIKSPVMLSELAKSGIKFDSIFVGLFIFIHVGSRFLSASFEIAHSKPDIYQPAANAMAKLWVSLPKENIILFEHIFWWLAIGLILIFLPYFPYSKHAHLFMGPINIMAKEKRKSMSALEKIDFED